MAECLNKEKIFSSLYHMDAMLPIRFLIFSHHSRNLPAWYVLWLRAGSLGLETWKRCCVTWPRTTARDRVQALILCHLARVRKNSPSNLLTAHSLIPTWTYDKMAQRVTYRRQTPCMCSTWCVKWNAELCCTCGLVWLKITILLSLRKFSDLKLKVDTPPQFDAATMSSLKRDCWTEIA